MAYATVADVRQMMPQVPITATSKPTDSDVTEWIAEIEGQLDAALKNMGYVTPVTGVLSIPILRDMVVHKVTAQVLQARAFGIGPVTETGAKEAESYFDKRVEWLADPDHPFELPDATRTGAEIVKGGGVLRAFVPDDDDPDEAPRATVGKVF